MRITWRKIFTTAALAFMLCLTGLVMSGQAQNQTPGGTPVNWRFVDNGNGTVTDTVTNLMWTKHSAPLGKLKWHDAMSASRSFSISGIDGWRLPTKEEFEDLYRAMQGGHPFTGVQMSGYWSSTSYAGSTDYAYYVAMNYGIMYVDSKTITFHVWPVRAGQ